MKRLISLILGLTVLFTFISAGCAESGSDTIAMVKVPVDAQDMRLAQCMVPQGYTVTPRLDICGDTRSVTDPLGLAIIATSPDGRIMMSYEKSNAYIQIVSSTIGGKTYRTHTDGKYDVETMTMMAQYMQPAAYAQSYLNGVFPGVQMTFAGSMDLSEYQPYLQKRAEAYYRDLKAPHPEAVGVNIDGVAINAAICGFTCEMNGEAYNIVVGTIIEATQMTMSMSLLQGGLSETEVLWSPLCTYVLACPASESSSVLSAFEIFMKNTTVSDQFTKANQRLANELRQIIVDGRMGSARNYSAGVLSDSISSGDSYDDERFTDYIFDQNDYTLSDGTHVKIPTSYDYVYEGDNNVVYFSTSAFPEPGTRLTPNR